MASGESESDENSIQVENITYFESKNQSKFSKKPNTTCQIFRGKLENGTKAFIRKFEVARVQQKDLEFQRDIELLREPERTSHMHKSFIHYFCFIKHGEFYYVATEWCICSVEDLYDIRRNGHNWEGNEIDTKLIKESLGGKKELLRQATEGVAFLHAMGFVHRNLKPSNFLIAQLSRLDREGFKYLVKVSDFRMSKHLGKQPNHSGQRGSDGWISPYPPKNDPQEIKTHPSEDVFILGCFFHYVLTNGKHPFGDNGIERELNVKTHYYEVYLAKWKPEIEEIQAISLVKDMIKYDPEERPALKTILGRAYFLPDDYTTSFTTYKLK
ncbi:serine/threonine-protein kinase/endoribonuclease IRE1-like isoform X2 [Daphnia pulex]|uniref:serine/threonine-protein kinase/endoribonuclease IRE1-like isoform X2 n=1 Tax=Daphnia pulex TaxID=6669 RepID=UPI001EDD50EF|nr:serine/threonine-protein kinase/endoribonuclease IRE1-like isoform X2 [Daphnia pulex]